MHTAARPPLTATTVRAAALLATEAAGAGAVLSADATGVWWPWCVPSAVPSAPGIHAALPDVPTQLPTSTAQYLVTWCSSFITISPLVRLMASMLALLGAPLGVWFDVCCAVSPGATL